MESEEQRNAADWKEAYQGEAKRAVQLAAQNKMIVEAATKRIGQADQELAQLNAIINSICARSVEITTKWFQGHPNLKKALEEMQSLRPLQVGGVK